MSEINYTHDDEIDLFELFQKLWDGKWKIIATTFVAAIFGVVFSYVPSNSFIVSSPIYSGKQSVFLQYTLINDLLKNEEMLFDENTNPNGFIVNNSSIFQLFVTEFNDYQEMVDALSKSEFVQQSIRDLDDDEKQSNLINFAKAFKLKAPLKNEDNWTMSFEWHNELEGKQLLHDAISQTLLNVKNDTKISVEELANTIDIRNKRMLEKLREELNVIEKNEINKNKQLLNYLFEQSAIAKELDIETNIFDANALSLSAQNSVSLNVNSNNVPFYLRGYKAIDKEISLIQSRTVEEILLGASKYLTTKEKILLLETDLSSSQLRESSEAIAIDNPNDWVEYNPAIADVKSQKKSPLIIALSMFLGGTIGAMYILILNTIRKRQERLASA